MSGEENTLLNPSPNPLLLVLSGLSGVGKDTVLAGLKQSGFSPVHIITVTTRPKRPRERDGAHYHFVSEDKFQEMEAAGELMESANVYGNWYGVPREPVREALNSGRDVIVKVDVQGAMTIKSILPEAVFIFLAPPSMEELIARLQQRRTEAEEDLNRRVKTASEELAKLPLFDYIVTNRQDAIDHAVADIKAVYRAEKCRAKPREISL